MPPASKGGEPTKVYLYPFQRRAWDSKKRIVALVGGTGAGKTWLAPRIVYKWLTQRPGSRVLAIGTGYTKHVERVMMFEIEKFFTESRIKYVMNKTSAVLTLSDKRMPGFGSQVLFGSSDNALSLEGPHLENCWIDEAGLMGRTTFEVAQRRTGMRRGQILITTIPYFENWLRSDIYEPAMKGDPDIDWINCKTSDNEEYPDEEIERMRRTMRPEKFKAFYEGEFAKAFGLIYPFPDDDELVVPPFTVPDDWMCFSGHDWGWNDPMTGVWGRLSPDGTLYIVADYESNEKTIDDHVAKFKASGLDYVDGAYGDPSAAEVWQRSADIGYPVWKANNDVQAGINAVYDRMVTGKIKFFATCRKLIDHRTTYRWDVDPRDEEILMDRPKPHQAAGHMYDALRYLCLSLVHEGLAPEPPVIESRGRRMG